MENASAVGADLYAGAEFTEFRRLLIDIDIDSALDECERRSEPADTGADDDDFFVHERAVPSSLRLAGGVAAQIGENVVALQHDPIGAQRHFAGRVHDVAGRHME